MMGIETRIQTFDKKNGSILTDFGFLNGLPHGKCVNWFVGNLVGQKYSEIHYINNVRQGRATDWYGNGEYMTDTYYERGLPEGEELTSLPF
ncbi:MAG: hypothetical protein HC836_32995 [Richelia sp. RM2_1_2]|nr:hypothetical protein [Richelia sp. RM2_1_2]